MAAPRIFFVHLRRPDKSDPYEQRADPFYEFGSFGCTGCHSKNLLHPRNARKLEGARLAFVQGGTEGSRLVFLTPPITITVRNESCEARWKQEEMPFKYTAAPILIHNDGSSDFETVRRFILSRKNSQTLESRLASLLRSRTQETSEQMATQIVAVYTNMRADVPRSAIAKHYEEALPYEPNNIDRKRKKTYASLVRELTDGPRSLCSKPRRSLSGDCRR